MRRFKYLIVSSIFVLLGLFILYKLNFISHKKYSNEYFDISTYISKIDKDNDGIDDQSDILRGAKEYVGKKPKYKSKYYATGYPNDEYGNLGKMR